MKIVHFGGGLGNQMANYATLTAARMANPEDTFLSETLVYQIADANESCNQWNGYELDRVFGIKVENVLDRLSDKEKESVIHDLKCTEFWKRGNEEGCIRQVLITHGFLKERPFLVSDDDTRLRQSYVLRIKNRLLRFMGNPSRNYASYYLKEHIKKILIGRFSREIVGYKKREGDYYYAACTFEFMKTKWLHQKIGAQLKDAFLFPPIDDERNSLAAEKIRSVNSVSIHARRSDFLQYNSDCYRFGYFKRCTKFIRKKVENPVFFIFSEDSGWCKEHLEVFGLEDKRDQIYFIDWNHGKDSFRDMQLMSMCRHNIITKSSFGWWASFLNPNPDKITCCQISEYISTNQF